MLEKISRKLRSWGKSVRNHIMLKKEVYALATFLLGALTLFISSAVIYNYTVYLENKEFHKKYQTIEYENLITDLKEGKLQSYSKNIVVPESVKFSNFWYDTRRAGTVDSFLFTYKDGKSVLYTEDSLKSGSLTSRKEDKELATALYNLKIDQSTVINFFPFSFRSIFDTLILVLGFIFVIFAAQFLIAEFVSGKNFNQKKLDTDIYFDDIVGYKEVKEQFMEIVKFIKNKKSFEKNSLTVPKGILLTGEPGVGKTLFAKAFANEVNATLFFASGADFAEMYVGVGAKRVRSLFRSATMAAPSVIFIDEFDAVGSRSTMMQDSERISVINQLLTEMDGLNKKADIFVIATTNYESKIDPALLRPGRIDKTINIPLPEKDTRIAIMKKYLSDFICQEQDLEAMAIKCQNMSAASLKNLVEQAKSLTIKTTSVDNREIPLNILNEAFDNISYGGKRALVYNDNLQKRIALHELGHAVTSAVLMPSYTLEKISIEARSKSLGATFMLPKDEIYLNTYDEMISSICMLLGGRAAEELFLGQASTGAADDLQKANTIAHEIINVYGLGKDTSLLVDIFPNTPIKEGQQLAQRQKLLQDCFVKTTSVLKFYRKEIEQMAEILIKEKQIQGQFVIDTLNKKPYELQIMDLNEEDIVKINNV